jgi:preprotein translocase subunit SecG
LATAFFLTSLTLAYFATQTSVPKSVVERVQTGQPAADKPKDGSGPTDVPQLPRQPQ